VVARARRLLGVLVEGTVVVSEYTGADPLATLRELAEPAVIVDALCTPLGASGATETPHRDRIMAALRQHTRGL